MRPLMRRCRSPCWLMLRTVSSSARPSSFSIRAASQNGLRDVQIKWSLWVARPT